MSIDAINGRNHLYDGPRADEDRVSTGEEASPLSSAIDDSSTSSLLLDGDINAQVAALVIRSAQKQREANRDIQVAEEAALERAEARQVEAIHDQADDIRAAGTMEGLSGMASGACTIGGALATNARTEQLWKGGGTIGEAGGKWAAGIYKGAEKDDDANARTYEHEAGHHHRNLDAARDGVREGQDLLERALDFYKQSQQSANDAVSTSVRRA